MGRDGIVVHGNVQGMIKVDERGKPVSANKAGIAGDKKSPKVGSANPDVVEIDFDG